MSSPKIKEAVEMIDEASLAAVSSDSAEKRNGGSSFDLSEILAVRFDSLTPSGARGGAAFYIGRELGEDASDNLVALKVFTGHDERQRELFQLEASTAARLSHKNIIKSQPPQEIEDLYFSVMEHRSEAETLKALLEREGWLEPAFAIVIADQLAEGLEYAHGAGVLHLALSAETILIDKDGTALLTDFGLETGSDSQWVRMERSCHGPIHYISPEQANGRPSDERSDLYSLGVVLYQMLTDRLPIDAENGDSIRQKRGSYSPLSPHLYSADIPLSLSAVVTRLLDQDPSKRFQNAASLREALEACVSSHTGAEEPMSESLNSEIEENFAGSEEEPLDLDALVAVPIRQSWEIPTIRVVNPHVDEIAAPESHSVSMTQSDALEKPTDKDLRAVEDLPARELQSTTDRQWGPLILPLILAIALTLVVIGGVIGLAGADRAKASDPKDGEAPAAEQGQDNGVNRIATPSADTPELAPPAGSQPAVSGESAVSTRAGAGSTSARTAARSRRIRALRPAVPARLRQNRRRSPAGYWRNYPYHRRR